MIELIPAIDVIDGKCVRLSQGDYQSKKVYHKKSAKVVVGKDIYTKGPNSDKT